MDQKRDYYEVLGVNRSATDQELKSAYRRLAMQYHPDRNPENVAEAEERFKEITEAYGVLADPDKRAAYDRFGFAGVNGGAGGAPDFSSTIFSDFEDLFGQFFDLSDLFGGQRRPRRPRPERGADLRYDLELSFEEAAAGLDTKIKIPRGEICSSCHGSGGRVGSEPSPCPACGGHGQMRHQQGFFTVTRTCPQCGGAGQVNLDPCPACRGEGVVRREKVLGIKIPAGVDDGTRLRVGGEGEAGRLGGNSGDLYVVVSVRPHSFYDRRGDDLYCTIPVSIAQAALGAEIKVPTLRGPQRLSLPEGTQPGSVFRMRGQGMPSLNGKGRGDLYVVIQVNVPTRLSREQRHMIEMISPSLRVDNKPLERASQGKAKNIFG